MARRKPAKQSALVLINRKSGTARSLKIKHRPRRLGDFKWQKGILSTIDGELVVLSNPVKIDIRPMSLKVLAAKPPLRRILANSGHHYSKI